MIAVDTNILVYAHRPDSKFHVAAREAIRALAETQPWALPWPCLYEFYNIVTHPRRYGPPSPPEAALAQIEAWRESPFLRILSENEAGWSTLSALIVTSRPIGPKIHDARIVSLCLQHGVVELWSMDRDFSRFPQLRTVNPLIPRANEPRARYGKPAIYAAPQESPRRR